MFWLACVFPAGVSLAFIHLLASDLRRAASAVAAQEDRTLAGRGFAVEAADNGYDSDKPRHDVA